MKLKKGFTYLRNVFSSYTNSKVKYKPKILSYLITNQCNSHCVTCNAWKKTEQMSIDLESLREVLKKDLFAEIQHVGISGGEPSTFSELQKHIEIILSTLPKIETLSITSNCILSNFWITNLCGINNLCKSKGVYFQFNISLDGIGRIHDKIRGTKNNFEHTIRVIEFAQKSGINYQLHTTISKYNVYHVNEILRFAKSKDADIIFRLASRIFRLDNEKHLDRVALNDKELSFICDFFLSDALLNYTKSPGRKLFYKHLVWQVLNDGKRKAPCYFKHQGLVLASDGTISYCSRFSENFTSINDMEMELKYYNRSIFERCANEVCQSCYHDQTGLWPLHKVLGVYFSKFFIPVRKVWTVFSFLFRGILKKTNKSQIRDVENVCILGMYGGEHVGDAAILGGSILRVLQRHPAINKITIYSFRKDRTECWVNNLTELPKNIFIEVCGCHKDFAEIIKKSDMLMWAGGPVMELPVVLSRIYYFIKVAKSVGITFEMEGIGYGPINTYFGKLITKRIIDKANYLTVRSESDKKRIGTTLGLNEKDISQDPAFTYLASIPQNPTLDVDESRSIDKILKYSQDKVIAINLRPLWKRYGRNTTFDSDSFLTEIIKTISLLKDTTIIFFPMNTDQYGFSDLDVAYKIKEKLSPECDFRIWEYEPTVNGVITLLRNVDVAICMRFHAAIFSLSQGVKTIGLDYSLSGKGKVSSLFENIEDECLSILDFKAEYAINKII